MTVEELMKALAMLPGDLKIGLHIFIPLSERDCFADKIMGIIISKNGRVYIDSTDGEPGLDYDR